MSAQATASASVRYPDFPALPPSAQSDPSLREFHATQSRFWDDVRRCLSRAGIGGSGLTINNSLTTIDAGNINGRIKLSQIEPGFATQIEIDELSAKYDKALGLSQAAFSQFRQVYADDKQAFALEQTRMESDFNNTTSRLTEDYETLSTDTSALASRTTTLETTVNNPTTGVAATASGLSSLTTTVTTQGSQITANASSITNLTAKVGSSTDSPSTAGSLYARYYAEANVRATNDGYLSGQYVVKVDAGGRVAGMKITAISDPTGWTSTSEIAFNADVFKIYNGSSNVAPFTVDTVTNTVKMTNVVVTSELDVGTGATRIHIKDGVFILGGGLISGATTSGNYELTIGSPTSTHLVLGSYTTSSLAAMYARDASGNILSSFSSNGLGSFNVGSAANPSIGFTGTSTGIYVDDGANLSFVTSGVTKVQVRGTDGVLITHGIQDGSGIQTWGTSTFYAADGVVLDSHNKLHFFSTSNGTSMYEYWGINMTGDYAHPIQANGASITLFSASGGGKNYGTGRLWLSETGDDYYLYVSGSSLIFHKGSSGDITIA